MNDHWLGGMTLRELARRSYRETTEDKVFSRAAELAYYLLLALFPMLIFLSSLIGFLPDAQERVFHLMGAIVLIGGEINSEITLAAGKQA